MIGKDYVFSTVEDRYAVCGEIFNSVENAKNLLKMKHVKRYVIIYRIFDSKGNVAYDGNATVNRLLMKDRIKEVKVGKINVSCIEEFKHY